MLCIIPMQTLIAAACWLLAGAPSSTAPAPQKICVSDVQVVHVLDTEVARLRVNGEARSFVVDQGSKWNDGEITLFSSQEQVDERRSARDTWSVIASIRSGQISAIRASFDGEDAHGHVGYSQSYERELP